MIDTHAHLDALDDPSGALARARAAGVDRIVAIGSGIASARATRAIAAGEDGVYPVLGIHPHQAADGECDELRALAAGHAVAVGEIGLDFYRDYAPRSTSSALFEAQLELASELGKPVVDPHARGRRGHAPCARRLRGEPSSCIASRRPGFSRSRSSAATTSRSPAT